MSTQVPYQRVVKAGDFLFTAGLISVIGESERRLDDIAVRQQAREIFSTLREDLKQFGVSFDNIVSLLQYYRGKSPVAAYVGERAKFFPTRGLPCSTSIAVHGLAAAES